MNLSFTVPGRAIPAVRMTQRSKYSKQARRYLAYKGQVGWVARSHMQGQPTDAPIGIEIKVFIHGGRHGDIDNYAKSIADSLNKIVYKDDKQIEFMKLRKISCQKGDDRVEVSVYELDSFGNVEIS